MGGSDNLSFTGKRWIWPQALAAAQPPLFVNAILTRRGIVGDAVAPYLTPSLASLADPAHMADMAAAV
ncbi:MAG: hypothetical protein HYZ27_06710, partial [Deltaproteobacteria bacterium]|nr:hypothetical protein [Deltaproteobacteria bacterium]